MLLQRINSIFPRLHSSIIFLKSVLFFSDLPVIPSSANIPTNSYLGSSTGKLQALAIKITVSELSFFLLSSPMSLALLLYATLSTILVIQDLIRRTSKKTVLEKIKLILLPLLVSVTFCVVLLGEVNRGGSTVW